MNVSNHPPVSLTVVVAHTNSTVHRNYAMLCYRDRVCTQRGHLVDTVLRSPNTRSRTGHRSRIANAVARNAQRGRRAAHHAAYSSDTGHCRGLTVKSNVFGSRQKFNSVARVSLEGSRASRRRTNGTHGRAAARCLARGEERDGPCPRHCCGVRGWWLTRRCCLACRGSRRWRGPRH